MIAWLTALLLVGGSALAVIAAIGVLRLPDAFMRMHAAAKAGTLSITLLLAAVTVHFGSAGVGARAALVVAFLFLTAPVANHAIARAAYRSGAELWEKTRMDELRHAEDELSRRPT